MGALTHPTSKKALELLKANCPNNWAILVEAAKKEIKATKKHYKLRDTPQENHKAAMHCMTLQDDDVRAYALLAAAFLMDQKADLFNDHFNYEAKALRIEGHLEQLAKCDWPASDKSIIRAYYNRCLATINEHILGIISQIEVHSPIVVPSHRLNRGRGSGGPQQAIQ